MFPPGVSIMDPLKQECDDDELQSPEDEACELCIPDLQLLVLEWGSLFYKSPL
jgi:hypothetical protein